MKQIHSFVFLFFTTSVAAFFMGVFLYIMSNFTVHPSALNVPRSKSIAEIPIFPTPIIITESPILTVVGDIMLARSVELSMISNGGTYPFKYTKTIFGSSTAVLANFEAAIPLVHKITPPNITRFSVSPFYLTDLATAGVTHVSLANNHSFDYGAVAFNNTANQLQSAGISTFGNPDTITSSSISYVTLGDYTIGIIGLHAVYKYPDEALLKETLAELSANSDFQVVYVHWGTEYVSTHSQSQETLATSLVSFGADTIIGHHPHVVQDIQLINGVPVFYSLGNFIFDQYFSTEVQEGLVLQLSLAVDNFIVALTPVSSSKSRSQPQLMEVDQAATFLANLAAKSDSSLSESIKTGNLILPYHLQNP